MNVVFTVTLPRTYRGKHKTAPLSARPPIEEEESLVMPFQNIYATVDATSLKDLMKMLHEHDFILAREFNAKQKFDGSRLYEDRGDVIINCQMIGKIKPFFE